MTISDYCMTLKTDFSPDTRASICGRRTNDWPLRWMKKHESGGGTDHIYTQATVLENRDLRSTKSTINAAVQKSSNHVVFPVVVTLVNW